MSHLKAEIAKIVITPDVYFYTRQPVYNSYATNVVIKTISWNNITNYSASGNDDFTLNNGTITILKSGVYRIYYHDIIKGTGTGSNRGFLVFDVENSIEHESHYSEQIDNSQSTSVHLDFQTYLQNENQIRIRAYNVSQFGHRGVLM